MMALTIALLTWVSVGQATTISNTATDADGGGLISTTTWDAGIASVEAELTYNASSGAYEMTIGEHQSAALGHTTTDFSTCDGSLGDPTIKSIQEVTNDTGVAWTAYEVTVTVSTGTQLNPGFAIVGQPTPPTVTSPDGWSALILDPLTYVGMTSGSLPYQYSASIFLAGGTPVADGDELDYSYKITFSGSASYHVDEGQAPVFAVPIPEPSTLVLALGGLLGLAVLRVSRRRRP
jgi:hypothetical protein